MFTFYFVYSACIVSPFVYILIFTIFLQVYRALPLGGNTIAVNKYYIYIYMYIKIAISTGEAAFQQKFVLFDEGRGQSLLHGIVLEFDLRD